MIIKPKIISDKVIKGFIVPATVIEKKEKKGTDSVFPITKLQKWIGKNIRPCTSISCFPKIKNFKNFRVYANDKLKKTPPNDFSNNSEELKCQCDFIKSINMQEVFCQVCNNSAIELDVNNTLKSNRSTAVSVSRTDSTTRKTSIFDRLSFKYKSYTSYDKALDNNFVYFRQQPTVITFSSIFGDLNNFAPECENSENSEEYDEDVCDFVLDDLDDLDSFSVDLSIYNENYIYYITEL